MPKINTDKTATSCTAVQSTEAIRKIARELYEKSGRKQGQDLKNWLEAERIVKSRGCC